MPAASLISMLILVGLFLPGQSRAFAAAPLRVWAAASLTDALREIGARYDKESGQRVVFNFAGSGTLARQIEAGAPADVFFSADEAQMDRLAKRGMILPETRVSRLSNQLVLVVNRERPSAVATPRDLSRDAVARVALAQPDSVPAGIYARTYLEKQRLWRVVGPKVVPTQNVRAALAAVEAGNVDAAFVYKTDAAVSTEVKVVYEVPLGEGPAISYPAAVLQNSRQSEKARQFLDYLGKGATGEVFARHGFLLRSSKGDAP